ncbi:hypothetical protein B0F90DRAFT_1688198, partial [Multifurca ochricompacta]
INREQEPGLDKNRKKFDAREEYFKWRGEPGRMGMWAHRKTERLARMGCRTCSTITTRTRCYCKPWNDEH